MTIDGLSKFTIANEPGEKLGAWNLEAEAEAEAEAWTLEAEAEAEAWTIETEATISGLEAEARPRGLTSLLHNA